MVVIGLVSAGVCCGFVFWVLDVFVVVIDLLVKVNSVVLFIL